MEKNAGQQEFFKMALLFVKIQEEMLAPNDIWSDVLMVNGSHFNALIQ